MTSNPRYHLLENNCQHLVEALVAELCNGAHVEQAKLSEELEHVSPKIAMDMMASSLRSRIDVKNEGEDSEGVKEDVDVLKSLLKLYESHGSRKRNNSTAHAAIEAGDTPLAIMPPPPPVHESAPQLLMNAEHSSTSGLALQAAPLERSSPALLAPPMDRSAPALLGPSSYSERSPRLPARPTSRGMSPGPVYLSREPSPALPPRPSSSLSSHPITPPYFPPPPNGAG